jgi:hypothetical protein
MPSSHYRVLMAKCRTVVTLQCFDAAMAYHFAGVALWCHHSVTSQRHDGVPSRLYSTIVFRHCGITTL